MKILILVLINRAYYPVETKKSLGVLKIGESLLKVLSGGKLMNCRKIIR